MTTQPEALARALEMATEGMEIHGPDMPEYKVCAELRRLHAENEALTAAARQALASGAHIYAGNCPDDTQPEANDPACPACRAIVALNDALKGQA